MIGVKNFIAPLFHPIRSKTKTNRNSLALFSRALRQLRVITSSFDWFTVWYVAIVSDHFDFGFPELEIENRSIQRHIIY